MNRDTLTKLKPFIYGKMLGDATIEKVAKPTYNSKFRVKQKADHKEYVEQCWRKMHNHSCRIYLSGSRRTHRGMTKTHYSWVFKSKADPIWNELRQEWYNEDGTKRLPSDLESYFNAELLAYWFMDDGYTTPDYQKFIATQSFSENQVDYLILLINTKFNLGAVKVKERVDTLGVQRYLIRFSGKEVMVQFRKLVESYIPKCLEYKIRTPWCL